MNFSSPAVCDKEPYFTDGVVKDYVQRGLHKVCTIGVIVYLLPDKATCSQCQLTKSWMCTAANGIDATALYGVLTCWLVFFCLFEGLHCGGDTLRWAEV